MDQTIHTVLIIHLAREWRIFHRRDLILALAVTIPEGWAILAVNRPITLDVTLVRDPKRLFREAGHRAPLQLAPRLFLYTPRQISHELIADRVPGMPSANRRLVHRQLRDVIDGLFGKLEMTMSWISHPVQSWARRLFPGEKAVYECYDDYSRFADGSFRKRVWAAEKRVLADTDLLLYTSELIGLRRRELPRRSCYLPNGVSSRFFDHMDADRPAPAKKSAPLIGYLGNMYPFMAHSLLFRLCRDNPKWNFVLAGPGHTAPEIKKLESLPNVTLPGPIPAEDVPEFMRQLDVALIPFELNEYVNATNPLKTYEYMAAGVPIVASGLPELRKFHDSIRLVPNTAKDFTRAIAQTLAEDRKILGDKLIATAREYTWDTICKNVVVPELIRLAGS